MKKNLLLACLLFVFSAAMAVADYRVSGTYVSSCGVTWSVVAHNTTMSGAFSDLSNLEHACDAACGTSATQIIM
jgi:hypothetical protein